MLSDVAFVTMNPRQKWLTIAVSHLQISNNLIQLYFKLMYIGLGTVLYAISKHITLLFWPVCDLL